jgi:hypothetical protein
MSQHLCKINQALNHSITGGSEFLWQCYGDNARFLDYESKHGDVSVVFDSVTQTVYEASVSDKDTSIKPYRWLNPEYKENHFAEAKTRGVDPYQAWDDVKWVDVDLFEDFLEKAKAILNGESFDHRVMVSLELENDVILQLAMEAHKRDITMNQLIEQILQAQIEKENLTAKPLPGVSEQPGDNVTWPYNG